MSDKAYVNASYGGQPPPPSTYAVQPAAYAAQPYAYAAQPAAYAAQPYAYAAQPAAYAAQPAAYAVQPAAYAYTGDPTNSSPQYAANAHYGGAPNAVGFAQPVAHQNVQVNVIGATTPQPTLVVAHSTTMVVAPTSYLGWSIFNLLCCFWPLGLAALIFSIKVGSARTPDEARAYSLTARNLNIAATVVAPVLVVVIVGAILGTAATAAAQVVSSCYTYRSSYYGTYNYYC